jgi:hypothetical protein
MYDIKGTKYTIDPSGTVYGAGGLARKFSVKPTGYCEIALSVDGKIVHKMVHRLMWEAANGPIPSGMHINHIDGDKQNNALGNLECLTPQENYAHAKAHLVLRGTQVHTAKLSEEAVREIRIMGKAGVPTTTIATKFSVSKSTVNRILAGSRWNSVV